MQILRWLQVHGLTFEGVRCVKAGCKGVFRLATRKRKHKDKETEETLLRCGSCKQEKTARGEFFSCYKTANLHETFQMLYGVAERWRPDQLHQELNIRDRSRFVAMMDHVGKICQFYLELLFKHSLGRWDLLGVDEAATGQAKKARSGKTKQPTKKGLRWWLSILKYQENSDGSSRRCEGFFFEPIPKLEWVDSRTGLQKCKIRTSEHLSWHIERLAAKGATLITDSHKGYQVCGTEKCRPDIIHHDNNHSKGFAAPGKKSIDAGIAKVCNNMTEGGGHGTLYKLIRPWLGKKIGSGSDTHELLVKDTGVAMMNWRYQGKDILQEIFLWMRYMYGSLGPTTLEKNICNKLVLEPGPVPDYKSIEEIFEGIDLKKSPWEFVVGPELPQIRKAQTTRPAFFECAWKAHVAGVEQQREVSWTQSAEPPSFQLPRRLCDITAPFLSQPATRRPKGKQPRKPRRRFPAAMPHFELKEEPDSNSDFDLSDAELAFFAQVEESRNRTGANKPATSNPGGAAAVEAAIQAAIRPAPPPAKKQRTAVLADVDEGTSPGTSGVSFNGPLRGLVCCHGQRQLQLDTDLGWPKQEKENCP